MKWLAPGLGTVGGVLAWMTGNELNQPAILNKLPSHVYDAGWPSSLTVHGLAVLGLLGALLTMSRPRLGGMICLAVAGLGIFFASEMWDMAGSVFFVVVLLSFFDLTGSPLPLNK